MADTSKMYAKIKVLNERLWEDRVPKPVIDLWMDNFAAEAGDPSERAHALWLLSQFIYFGDREVRTLLRALYRDHYRYPIIEEIRRSNSDTTDAVAIDTAFQQELASTKFLGIGNPAESGTHLLYYFRQVNRLGKERFDSLADLFNDSVASPTVGLRDPALRRFVFIDDFCGSAQQATQYSTTVLGLLRDIAARAGVTFTISYLVLVATEEGLNLVRANTDFDRVEAVFELDDSYKSVSPGSKHFATAPPEIEVAFARTMAEAYGRSLWPANPLGWRGGELLLGFHHNIPDNVLPIIWFDENEASWTPVLPRYPKLK
jgi:hypothetical protein